jgi:hypothetical protein
MVLTFDHIITASSSRLAIFEIAAINAIKDGAVIHARAFNGCYLYIASHSLNGNIDRHASP